MRAVTSAFLLSLLVVSGLALPTTVFVVRNSLTARTLHFTYASDSTNFGSLGQMALDATLGPVVDMTSCHVDGALFLFILDANNVLLRQRMTLDSSTGAPTKSGNTYSVTLPPATNARKLAGVDCVKKALFVADRDDHTVWMTSDFTGGTLTWSRFAQSLQSGQSNYVSDMRAPSHVWATTSMNTMYRTYWSSATADSSLNGMRSVTGPATAVSSFTSSPYFTGARVERFAVDSSSNAHVWYMKEDSQARVYARQLSDGTERVALQVSGSVPDFDFSRDRLYFVRGTEVRYLPTPRGANNADLDSTVRVASALMGSFEAVDVYYAGAAVRSATPALLLPLLSACLLLAAAQRRW